MAGGGPSSSRTQVSTATGLRSTDEVVSTLEAESIREVVPTVDVTYRHRVGKPCRGGTARLTLVRGGQALERRTLRLGRNCRVSTMFRVARDDSAQLRVVQQYRGRTTSARLLAPRLGSRGLDERLQAPAAL